MKLKASDDLNYANYLIDSGLLNKRKNMIWFTKYLIREYAQEHGLEINVAFLSNLDVVRELLRTRQLSLKKIMMNSAVLGEHHQDSSFANQHDINVYTGGRIFPKNETLPELLFSSFHEVGHAVIEKSMRDEYYKMLGLENFPSYSKKYYQIYKDRQVINVVGEEAYRLIHDLWYGECEANIVAGEILLEMIDDNFDGKEFAKQVRYYVEELITNAKMILYSSKREELSNANDTIIRAIPGISSERHPLRVEYNADGSRKSLFELFQMRKQLQQNLDGQLVYFYFDLESGQKTIDEISKINNELLNDFIYKAIENYSDEEFGRVLSTCSDEEVEIILDSINQQESEIQDAMEFVISCRTKVKGSFDNTFLDYDVSRYISDKYVTCSRLRKILTERRYVDSVAKR